MGTTIRKTDDREVTLSYTNEDGEKVERVFWIPNTSRGRGYIRERRRNYHDASDPQVCDALYSTGSTLEATPETLLSIIRREWRKHRRREAIALAKDRW